MGKLTEWEAVNIAEQAYRKRDDAKSIRITIDGERINWKTQDIIQDKDTGLNGYVLQNEDTGKVVISFEGTQVNHGTGQLLNDVGEDIFGIGLGGQSYTQG